MVAEYCTVAQVTSQLGLVDQTGSKPVRQVLDADSNPSSTEIVEFIEDAQDYVDEEAQTAWRVVTITREKHSIYRQFRAGRNQSYSFQLNNRLCKDFDDAQGDELRIFDGDAFTEWLTTKTSGDAPGHEDYYFDFLRGRVYLNTSYPARRENNIEVTYRKGQTPVPNQIRRATILLAAANIVESGILDYERLNYGNDKSLSNLEKADKWRDRATHLIEVSKVPLPFSQH